MKKKVMRKDIARRKETKVGFKFVLCHLSTGFIGSEKVRGKSSFHVGQGISGKVRETCIFTL